jgi:predicted HicB family RNase H-like nuclease
VMGLRDVVTFQGTTADEVKRAFRDSVDDYLAFCGERNESPEKAYSGKFMIRVEPGLHRRLAERSAVEGLSLNGWLEKGLRTLAVPESRPKYRPRRRARN